MVVGGEEGEGDGQGGVTVGYSEVGEGIDRGAAAGIL